MLPVGRCIGDQGGQLFGGRAGASFDGGAQGHADRMDAEVEQCPAAPLVGREVHPQVGNDWSERTSRWVISPRVGTPCEQLMDTRCIGEVLAVEQALAVCGRRLDDRIGLVERSAQRLLEQHGCAGLEQSDGVRSVALPGGVETTPMSAITGQRSS